MVIEESHGYFEHYGGHLLCPESGVELISKKRFVKIGFFSNFQNFQKNLKLKKLNLKKIYSKNANF